MTPEREAELFAKLDLMLELHRRTETDIKGLREEIRDVRAEMRDMRGEMRNLHNGQKDIGDRISRADGRPEEQSRFLQLALAGRLPRKPAA
jgi:septal ring factor EnvC (AmiA/AmiB activator)